jgi:hypothetical protein
VSLRCELDSFILYIDLWYNDLHWQIYLRLVPMLLGTLVFPSFENIRCFSFMKQMYLDIF